MLRHLVLALAAAALAGATLNPDDARAHRYYRHRAVFYGPGWGSGPRASLPGYPGGHYGRECYHAANGRWICPDRY